MLEVLKRDARALKYVSQELKSDKKIVLEAVKQHGLLLDMPQENYNQIKRLY